MCFSVNEIWVCKIYRLFAVLFFPIVLDWVCVFLNSTLPLLSSFCVRVSLSQINCLIFDNDGDNGCNEDFFFFTKGCTCCFPFSLSSDVSWLHSQLTHTHTHTWCPVHYQHKWDICMQMSLCWWGGGWKWAGCEWCYDSEGGSEEGRPLKKPACQERLRTVSLVTKSTWLPYVLFSLQFLCWRFGRDDHFSSG